MVQKDEENIQVETRDLLDPVVLEDDERYNYPETSNVMERVNVTSLITKNVDNELKDQTSNLAINFKRKEETNENF